MSLERHWQTFAYLIAKPLLNYFSRVERRLLIKYAFAVAVEGEQAQDAWAWSVEGKQTGQSQDIILACF
jgi:hypothetical protein